MGGKQEAIFTSRNSHTLLLIKTVTHPTRAAPEVMPFPLIFHYILLLGEKWQQRGSLTKWHLTWKCIWEQRYITEVLHVEKIARAECLWRPNRGCEYSETESCISAVATMTWKKSHVSDSHADFYEHGTQILVHCWWKCIANGGGHVEKYSVAVNLLCQMVSLCSLYLL